MSTDILSVLLRALSFIALFQAAGVAMFVAVFGRDLSNSTRLIRRLGVFSAIAGAVLVCGHYALEAARMAGALSGVFDRSLQNLVWHSSISIAWGLRVSGLVLIALGLAREGRRWIACSLFGAGLALVAFIFVGHTSVHPERGWLIVFLLTHLAIVAFWFGALAPLYLVSLKETPRLASTVVQRFSRIAGWWVPGILIAGALMTWTLVGNWEVFRASYGQLLLVKVAAFAVLLALATLNKWRFGPAIENNPRAVVSLRRAVAVEYGLIVVVLAVTAVMTTLFSPEQ